MCTWGRVWCDCGCVHGRVWSDLGCVHGGVSGVIVGVPVGVSGVIVGCQCVCTWTCLGVNVAVSEASAVFYQCSVLNSRVCVCVCVCVRAPGLGGDASGRSIGAGPALSPGQRAGAHLVPHA